ncbi:hypothetical protein HNR59_001237 [Aquamicrobium lusatiense]|uniref:Transmembrane protein n=1 Tax=Aquamicrobium lusatiense TaxID=89772 RepID=A0A7W9S0K2_9HYPH|nr:hypothetical protein [Aquamicrobium lusatiense]MBB6011892.1 hypothetical protein [Aquamicrobium lusatiense]
MITIARAYILASAALGAWAAVKVGPLLVGSPAALAGITSVFSILAGVLVAVISIIGDPSMLLTGNWRLGHEHAKDIQVRIGNYAHLVFVYVINLILVLACTVIQENKIACHDWPFSILAGVTVFALLMSLPLPYSLMSIQKERMEEEIKRRKTTPTSQ